MILFLGLYNKVDYERSSVGGQCNAHKKAKTLSKGLISVASCFKMLFLQQQTFLCSPSNSFTLRPQCTAVAKMQGQGLQLTSILFAESLLLLETKHPPAAQVKFAICFNCYSKVKCHPPEKGNMFLTSLVHSIVCRLLP